jgi:hypothetical protein
LHNRASLDPKNVKERPRLVPSPGNSIVKLTKSLRTLIFSNKAGCRRARETSNSLSVTAKLIVDRRAIRE